MCDRSNPRAVALLEQVRAELEGSAAVVEDPGDADVMVVLGGDGHLLRAVHREWDRGQRDVAVYGLNCGTVGFLLNRRFGEDGRVGLLGRLADSLGYQALPLRVEATGADGSRTVAWAINDVALIRSSSQAVHLAVGVNGVRRLDPLIGDGLVVATPAGSAAYNRSAGGPILPLGSRAISLAALAPYRPHGWSGAVLPRSARVDLAVVDRDRRPVMVTADHRTLHDVVSLRLTTPSDQRSLTVIHDRGWELEDRLLAEQFPSAG